MGIKVAYAIYIMCEVLSWGIVVHALLSWFLPPQNGLMRILDALLNPIVAPFRALLNKLIRKPMMVDFAPLLAMLAISLVIQPVLCDLALNCL